MTFFRFAFVLLLTSAAALVGVSFSQTAQTTLPTDPGMYIEAARSFTKIIGQIAEFKRSGSGMVSGATLGIKSAKANIQLLGNHSQTVVSPQPIFYFIPAKQEADAGVNAGDLILVRLEEKSKRRQFEIAAHGLWRSSSGISLTHQIQIFRSELKSGVYKIAPATTLGKGEYALFLSRGEGMAPYVYDFGVQETVLVAAKKQSIVHAENGSTPIQVAPDVSTKSHDAFTEPQIFKDASIGVFSDGNSDVRHDGVMLTALTAGGPADQAGMKARDVILAIDDRYLFTIGELKNEVSHHQPETQIRVRYRRYSTIYDASIVVGKVE